VVATGLPDAQLGAAIAVAVVTQSDKPFDMTAVMAKLRQALPAYMLPRHMDVWPALPRSANGKLDRVAITGALQRKFGEASA
jgi:acyl-coenzyme A synthetase/AMP-(fatty) acid ligase